MGGPRLRGALCLGEQLADPDTASQGVPWAGHTGHTGSTVTSTALGCSCSANTTPGTGMCWAMPKYMDLLQREVIVENPFHNSIISE